MLDRSFDSKNACDNRAKILGEILNKARFGFHVLKFNSHHINIAANVRSTKCRLIACMSAQSNLRDESIKPN
jgi:hypothetical protein